MPFALIMGYVYFTPVLMLYVPDHRCANASQTVGQCQMYSEDGSGDLVDCQYGYEYDTSGLFETAITDVRRHFIFASIAMKSIILLK